MILLGLTAAPAFGQDGSGCTTGFNGVETSRIDSLNSPLELDTDDTVIFSGTDPEGTTSAVVRLFVGPVPIESGTSTYATPTEDFTVTITLDDVAPYGVGLFRAEGETDSCSAAAWVRVSGRFPLATLTGLTAIGLTLGGVTGQLGAISSRRRWTRTAAAAGGIATGTGFALLGQQFGRLQLSYVSVAILVVAAGFLGWVAATLLNPGQRERRRAERRESAPEPPPVKRAAAPEPESDTDGPQALGADVASAPDPGAAEDRPEPDEGQIRTETTTRRREPSRNDTPPPVPEPTGPYWCYVLAGVEVFDLRDHTAQVATLTPGTWYLAKRTMGGWVHVVAGEGVEGWVAGHAVHRQG